jgi:2-isopropylmalate synthase
MKEHFPTPRLHLYDTTLRDGAQREGIALSVADKLKIAQQLDQLGIPFIEGGWPGANPKDIQFFWQLQQTPLRQAEVVAFCATRHAGQQAASDPRFAPVLAAGTRWITVFGKSWDLHVTTALQTTLPENLTMIADTVAYLVSQQRRVIYDAEHWFDGFKANPSYALATLRAACAAGAEWLVLCDTNGGTLPNQIADIVAAVRKALGDRVKLGIHAHNDAGTAVANSLVAVEAGVEMVQGTMNGYGERCGNANLCTIIPNLQLKLGYDCLSPEQLVQLTPSSRLISEIVNLAPDTHAPYVGLSAFAHKGGIHVSAVERDPRTYEHIEPAQIGNQRRIVISEQAGVSNVLAKARNFGIDLTRQDPACAALMQQLKQLESDGYQFEAAEASFELLLRQVLGQAHTYFRLRGFDVCCRHHTMPAPDQPHQLWHRSEVLATVKVQVGHEEMLMSAEAEGPVAALDLALRKALLGFYPDLAKFYLTDYKVRIIDSQAGTAAKTRVLVESSDNQQRWSTIGVSANIIEASYEAVAAGLAYGLMRHAPLSVPLSAAPASG